MPAENDSSSQNSYLSPSTSRSLAKYGITAINSADKIILKRNGSIVASIAKSSSSLLGPAISFLDAGVAQGVLRIQTKANIDRFYDKTGDIATTAKLRQRLSRGDHTGVVLKLLENGYRYKNLNDLTNQ